MTRRCKFLVALALVLWLGIAAQAEARKNIHKDHHLRSPRSKSHVYFKKPSIEQYATETTTASTDALTPNEITYLSVVAVLAAVILVLVGFLAAVTYRLRLYLGRALERQRTTGKANQAFADHEDEPLKIPDIKITEPETKGQDTRVDVHVN